MGRRVYLLIKATKKEMERMQWKDLDELQKRRKKGNGKQLKLTDNPKE